MSYDIHPFYILACKGIKKCPEPESNQRHEDFQSSALPTELSGHLVVIIITGFILSYWVGECKEFFEFFEKREN